METKTKFYLNIPIHNSDGVCFKPYKIDCGELYLDRDDSETRSDIVILRNWQTFKDLDYHCSLNIDHVVDILKTMVDVLSSAEHLRPFTETNLIQPIALYDTSNFFNYVRFVIMKAHIMYPPYDSMITDLQKDMIHYNAQDISDALGDIKESAHDLEVQASNISEQLDKIRSLDPRVLTGNGVIQPMDLNWTDYLESEIAVPAMRAEEIRNKIETELDSYVDNMIQAKEELEAAQANLESTLKEI